MTFDVIICTYNRPQKVLELVAELMPLTREFNNLIVVDSSDNDILVLKDNDDIVYLKSKYKNQPYQRYLGYLHSNADFILYLDDDMELAKKTVFEELTKLITETSNLSGIAIHFEDKHTNSTLNDIPRSTIFKKEGIFKRFIRWLTAYPILPDGKLGLCGNRGKQPSHGGKTEWVSGGAFLAKRSALFQNFNFQLFDLFEERLGMGEDAIIGYGLSKQGNLIYYPELLFYHSDQRDSLYSSNLFSFGRRIVYSRLYLSLEKSRLNGQSIFFARITFLWYAFWRVFGLILNLIVSHSHRRKAFLKGYLHGLSLTFDFKYKFKSEFK